MDNKTTQDFIGNEKPRDFLIVGIGASAGGIQVLREFFEHVPEDSGMAYVVILHLSPDHDSKLAEVLQMVSPMPVSQVNEKTKIEPDRVYVIPPNQHLIMEDGFIAPSVNTHMEDRRAPVDIFFRNLADTHGPRAVCVVLSGTGANGSMGLKRIKERGGVAYVQNPREAEFNEMPRNSIATELVDEILNVADIPARIIAYKKSLGSVQIVIEPEKRPEQQQQALREIFTQLRVRTGHDFSNYKRPTVLRRIERRINVRNLPDLPTYTAFLEEHPNETHALLKDLLISVTNFFRDKPAFEALERDVVPAIFSGKTTADQVRIWVAGCATGEEAYSIAMLCAEHALGAIDAPKVQIFATDIDESAITAARQGFYTINDAADVSPDRLRRFFNREGEGYRVRREIREMILFAQHNFLKDPPFSKLDLISCRNVLIYLNNTAQERVIETFHFALQPKGFLFLGTSESVDGASDLYATFSRDNHIFRARETSARNYPVPESVPSFQFSKNDPLQQTDDRDGRSQRMSFGDLHQKLLEQYAPPSVVINEDYEIMHMTDRVGKYFEFAGGEPTQNLLKLVRHEIRLELRSALYQAVQNKVAVEARNLRIPVNGQFESLDIHIRPVMEEGDAPKGYILVVFKPAEDSSLQRESIMMASDEPVARQLEEELIGLKTQLRNSIEQHEYQAEELKASNEELQAMNEELRSAAEELETSKEELQSINEELRTVNQELKVRIDETSITSNNLQNLINSANVGTIFLDRSFAIRLFTPAIQDLFNLKVSDYGRPVTDITNKLQYDELLQDAETVLEKLITIEREVITTDNRFFMMRLLPYRTSEDRINGVVVTFFDITNRKHSENALKQSQDRLRLLIESAKDYAIFTLDANRKVMSWSSGAEMMFGYSEGQMLGQLADIVFVPEDREQNVPEEEMQSAATKGRAENERWHLRNDGSRFWGSGMTHPLQDESGMLVGFVKIMRDLTSARRLEEAKFFLAAIVETSDDSVITIDFERNITSWNRAAEKLYGYVAHDAIGKNLSMVKFPEDLLDILEKVDAIQHSRQVAVFETIHHSKEGQLKHLEIVMSPVLNGPGEVIGISIIARDVTQRKKREANLAFLAKINLDFAPLLSEQEVMNPVGAQLASYQHLAQCQFSVVNEDENRMEVIYDYNRDGKLPLSKAVHRISDHLTEEGRRHFAAGKLAIMKEAVDNTLIKTPALLLRSGGQGSVVHVPYVEGGRWKFLLSVVRSEAGDWESDELELLQELASKIYIRIQRARSEEALRINELRFRIQKEAFQSAINNSPLKDSLNILSRMVIEEMNGEARTAFYIADTQGKFLHPVWQAGNMPKEYLEEIEGFRTGEDSMAGGLAVPIGNPVVTPDVHEEPLWKPWVFISDKYNYRGCWSFPIKTRDLKSIGTFALFFEGPREATPKDLALVDIVTQTAAVIISKDTEAKERKNAELASHQSEQRLRTLADAVPQVIWANDSEGNANYFNRRWHEYTGLSYDESAGPGWQAIVHPTDGPESIKKWKNALAAGEIFDTEYRLRRHDGVYRWFIGRNVPLKDDAGKITGWFGSATDIEDLKKTAEALSQSESRLRITMELVAERTIELKRSNEDLRQFAHVASHDLKEPVRKIQTFNNRILDEYGQSLPPKVKTYSQKIGTAADRMVSMIEGVLRYSKLDSLDQVQQSVNLNEIIEHVTGDLEILIEEKNAEISSTGLPTLAGNGTLLYQLFYNLILNSLKFSKDDDDPSRIEIQSSQVTHDDKPFVEITLTDNGIGFEQEFAEDIFKSFTRLNRAEDYEGTGLGLALCKKIVERHGGTITAKGVPDKGAKFTILLPVNKE